jgi:hypothetical protein
MGQWGLESSAGDSVHDYLQEIQANTDKFTQRDVQPVLDYTWNDIQVTNFDKLGVVMHLLTHELIVPIDKLKEVMEYANTELHPDTLANWRKGRKEMVQLEMNDMLYALANDGKGRARHTNGLLENMAEKIEDKAPKAETDDQVITLPCFGITIILLDPELHALVANRYGGGSITSDLKETCPYCEDPDCMMDCPDFGEYCSDRDKDEQSRKENERYEFLAHRAAADTIESMVLSHAVAGIDIESPAYIEGIETAQQALTNADYAVE